MAVGTIDSIKDYISKIDAQLIIFRKTMKESNSELDKALLDKALYGSESEYSLNTLYAGIKNIYTDIKFLTSNECYYIKYSIYDERQKLNSHLSNLYSYIQNDNYSQIAAQVDYIKSRLFCSFIVVKKCSNNSVCKTRNKHRVATRIVFLRALCFQPKSVVKAKHILFYYRADCLSG